MRQCKYQGTSDITTWIWILKLTFRMSHTALRTLTLKHPPAFRAQRSKGFDGKALKQVSTNYRFLPIVCIKLIQSLLTN